MVDKNMNEATWALVGSFQETSQNIVQRIVAAQERNTKFAQSFFSEGMDILKSSQTLAESIVAAQERSTKFSQSFFTEGMEVLKSHQALTDNIAALQERNMKFVQSFFTEGMEMLKSQGESARTMVQELQQKTMEQQEAFQQLAQASTETYLNFLRDPLSAYQQLVEATEASVRQGSDIGKKNRKSSSQ
jgi:hypothetical protein